MCLDPTWARPVRLLTAPSMSKNERGKKGKDSPKVALPTNYTPSDQDVICGRGKKIRNHSGNKFFRQIIAKMASAYSKSDKKDEKSGIVSRIVDDIHRMNGLFVLKDEGDKRWYVLDDYHTREKVGQSLRDACSHKYSSANRSKDMRRRLATPSRDNHSRDILLSNATIAASMNRMQEESRRKGVSDEVLVERFSLINSMVLEEIKRDTETKAKVLQFWAEHAALAPSSNSFSNFSSSDGGESETSGRSRDWNEMVASVADGPTMPWRGDTKSFKRQKS